MVWVEGGRGDHCGKVQKGDGSREQKDICRHDRRKLMYRELGTQGALQMRKDPFEGFIRDIVRQESVYCESYDIVLT